MAPIAIIASGTGLGESFLTWDNSQYVAHGSEGDIQILLQRTSVKSVCCIIFVPRFGHVGVERVCSGIGVPNIYEFLHDEENILARP
jgi:glucokinase